MKTILNWERLMGKFPGRNLRANCSCHTNPNKCLLTRSLEWVLGKELWVCRSFLPSQILYINHNVSSWLTKLPLFCFVTGKPCRLSEANRMAGIQGFLFWRSSLQWLGGESASCFCLKTCAFLAQVSSICFYCFRLLGVSNKSGSKSHSGVFIISFQDQTVILIIKRFLKWISWKINILSWHFRTWCCVMGGGRARSCLNLRWRRRWWTLSSTLKVSRGCRHSPDCWSACRLL